MALAMQEQLREMQAGWRDRGLIDRPFEARMGINTGYCTVGNFGSQDRMDCTIIGHQVNLAARLEAHADAGGILVAAETYSHVKDWLVADEQEPIALKGFSKPTRTYRVKGHVDEIAQDRSRFHHEDDGVIISIHTDRAHKLRTKEALEQALARLM
jgi:class 3 adenylate cyclase